MKLRQFPAAMASFAMFSALVAAAQQTKSVAQFTDPANLRGERVKPRDGRELPIDQGERGLEQMLRRLNTRASLMLIVAHPDDEDGGMLTYYSRGLGARVAMLTLTRGEGGQNAMTGDFEDALGLLRTQELLSADRYLGVDQFFGTEVDFGFSKTKEEAFKKWTHERVLYDAVRSIRLYRPLVIAAVFIGGVTDGHGQHQVSGQIAQEAFKAAADPTVFPDMIAEGILPWQALKVYARVPMQSISDKGLFDYATGKYTAPRFENYVTGEVTTTAPSADVIVHEGTVDPILSDSPSDPPRTYVQFARVGLGMQKSQVGSGMRVPPSGAFDVAYHLYGSALCSSPTHIKGCHSEGNAQVSVAGSAAPSSATAHESPETASFFDGIDTSMSSLAELLPGASPEIAALLQSLDGSMKEIVDWNSRKDRRSGVPSLLAKHLRTLDALIATLEPNKLSAKDKAEILHELRIKRVQTNDALVLALGLRLEAHLERCEIGLRCNADAIKLSVTKTASSEGTVTYIGSSEDPEQPDPSWLKVNGGCICPGQPVTQELPANAHGLSDRVYFSRPSIEQPYYDLLEPYGPDLRNAPLAPPVFPVYAHLRYDPADAPNQGAFLELVSSTPESPVPPVSVALDLHALVLPQAHKQFPLRVRVHAETANAKDLSLRLSLPSHWSAQPDVIHLIPSASRSAEDFDRKIIVISEPKFSAAYSANPTTVGASVALSDSSEQPPTFTGGYRPIGYGDLPRTNYYTPATVRIVPVDLNLPAAHRIAYLPGTGDAVPEALASVGMKPDMLSVADLTPAKLAPYDTVILGVRTYSAHADLHGVPTQALLEYARNGGNVLVQYQTAEFTAADAPYPLTLGYAAERVVDETDPVQLLDTSAPFLTAPNKITPADFNNWVEERGHGFLSTWDSRYTALTETHDPDEDPQRGGLITANVGKGRWTYCAFALYRQLPEAVPGAFRIFVNLISPVTSR